jgi:hypothetical protein
MNYLRACSESVCYRSVQNVLSFRLKIELYKIQCLLLVCVVVKFYVTLREEYKLRVFQIEC